MPPALQPTSAPMTPLYRLHYAPDNASLIVRLALEELGVAYDTVLVDRASRAQKSAAYRALNPAGLIPTLETPDGPIFETGAILLWLADRHAALAPAYNSPERASFLKWLFYLSNTVHPNLRLNFYASQYVGSDSAAQTALRHGARHNLRHALDFLEDLATAKHGWFNATSPSVCDLYLVAMLRWMKLYPTGGTDWFELGNWPNLMHLATRLQTRPSVVALCVAEGMDPNPFTNPRPPNPPEGSAL